MSNSQEILEIMEFLLTAVVDGRSQLQRLAVSAHGNDKPDLTSLDPALLSQALVRLEECHLGCFEDSNSLLSTDQLVAVMTAIEQTDNLKLKRFYFPNEDYSQVPTDVLAAALVKLEYSTLVTSPRVNNLPPDLATCLFTQIAENSNVKIVQLELFLDNFTFIPPELFGDALVRLESVNLMYTDDSEEMIGQNQVSSLFRNIVNAEQLRLRELEVDAMNLCPISPSEISEVVIKLETFNACLCDLTPEQVLAIFAKLSTSGCHKLRNLKLDGTDLSLVPTETLVDGISGLEEVELYDTKLTKEQITGIYSIGVDRECKTRKSAEAGTALIGVNYITILNTMQKAKYSRDQTPESIQ